MLSLLIPAFNEAAVIGATIAQAVEVLHAASIDHEVIVIDDGSTDGTAESAAAPGVHVLRHPVNAGYGRSLKTGLRQAKGEWIAIVDADGTYPIPAIPELVALAPPFDMVVGARGGDAYRGSAWKSFGRAALSRLVLFVAGVRVPDVNSGMRVFRRSIALENIDRIGNGFSFTTTLTLAMLLEGHFIKYVPIAYHRRVGSSKVRLGRDTLRMLQIVVVAILAYNPIKLFLALCGAAMIVGAIGGCMDLFLSRGAHLGAIFVLTGVACILVLGAGFACELLRRQAVAR